MYVHYRYVDIVEQFGVEFDRVARGKEYHYFLAEVLLEEREEQKESQLRGTHNIALRQKEKQHVELTTITYLPQHISYVRS